MEHHLQIPPTSERLSAKSMPATICRPWQDNLVQTDLAPQGSSAKPITELTLQYPSLARS